MDLLFWKKVSTRKLKKILDAHQVWFSSRQKEGKRANLFRSYLKDADLRRADLRGADLSGTNLNGANLEDATLMEDQLITAVIDELTVLPDGSKG